MDETQRLSANEIFDRVLSTARDELARSNHALAISGVACGLTMGLTALAVATTTVLLGNTEAKEFVPLLFYPIGFIAAVIGRHQLFTENTLYPVALILREKRHVLNTLRLWAIVFVANVVGAAIFAELVIKSGALHPEVSQVLQQLGTTASQGTAAHIFWSGVIGGWLIALLAWEVSASHWTLGQVMVIWLLAFVVGVGHFAHCIVSSTEILSAVAGGAVTPGAYLHWLFPATAGNIAGGVTIVTLLNYGQVHA